VQYLPRIVDKFKKLTNFMA